jgi:hypothetical protein
MDDDSLWFRINEDKGGEVVYFKRRTGRLWKLGDGTFGVVYVVHSELRANDFAVKLLYDNDSTTPRPLSRLPCEAVSAITQRVLEEHRWPPEHSDKLLENRTREVPDSRRPDPGPVQIHTLRLGGHSRGRPAASELDRRGTLHS